MKAGHAQDTVSGGEVGFLLEHIVELRGLGGVLDLPDPAALCGVGDVLDFLLADVAGGLVGAQRRVDQRQGALDAGREQDRGEEPRIDHRSRPLRDPEHRVVAGVGAQAAPGLVHRDRSGSRQRLADLAVAFQRRGDRGIVGTAQRHGHPAWTQPARGGEVRRAQRRGQGRHFLSQHRGGAFESAAGGADLPGGGLHVQGQADGRGVAFPGGSGTVDELRIGRRCPRIVGGAVCGPPFGQAGPGVGQGALQHLQRADPPGTANGGEHATPGSDAASLLGGVEEHERGMHDFADDGEAGLMGVVDHAGPGLRVAILSQPCGIAGQGEGPDRTWGHDPATVDQLPAGGTPEPPAGDRNPLHDRAARDRHPRHRR